VALSPQPALELQRGPVVGRLGPGPAQRRRYDGLVICAITCADLAVVVNTMVGVSAPDLATDVVARAVLEPGTRVDVRNRFEGRWSRGFEILEQTDDGAYLVLRLSDRSVLPETFGRDDVRRERRRDNWWY